MLYRIFSFLLAAASATAGTVTFADSLSLYQVGMGGVLPTAAIQLAGASSPYSAAPNQVYADLAIGTLTVDTSVFLRRPWDTFFVPLTATYELPEFDNYISERASLLVLEIFFAGDQYEIRYGGACCLTNIVSPAYPLFVGAGDVPRPVLATGTVGDVAEIALAADLVSAGVPEPATVLLVAVPLVAFGIRRTVFQPKN